MSVDKSAQIQCFCKRTKDDTDYKGYFKTDVKLEGDSDYTKLTGFLRKCKNCGLYRLNMVPFKPKDAQGSAPKHGTLDI